MNQHTGQRGISTVLICLQEGHRRSGEWVVGLITRRGKSKRKIMAGGWESEHNDKVGERVREKRGYTSALNL